MTRETGAANSIRWEIVLKKLQLYALGKAGLPVRTNRGGSMEHIIGDATGTSEVVSQAFEEVFEKLCNGELGSGQGEPLTEVYVLNLLKQIVRTRLVDLRRKIKSRRTDYAEEIKQSSVDDEKDGDFFDSYNVTKVRGLKRHQILSDPLPAPDEGDESVIYRNAMETIYEQVNGDRELEEMVRAICEEDGLRWPRDIAAHLNTTVEDIYNRQKKLRRRFNYLRLQKRTKVVS